MYFMALFRNVVRKLDKVIPIVLYYFHMTLEETLIKFGLEPKETKIYLAALELCPKRHANLKTRRH